jgi:hypothetical protein
LLFAFLAGSALSQCRAHPKDGVRSRFCDCTRRLTNRLRCFLLK